MLVRRWLALGELERRAFLAMAEDLTASDALVEQSTLDLSDGFRDLATAAEAQTGRVIEVARLARSITVAGEEVAMEVATGFVREALAKAVGALSNLSAQAGQIVDVLNRTAEDVQGAEAAVARIEAINRQASYVAINAAIEAHRAENSGGTFMVIAQELKDLSVATDATATLARGRIAALAHAIRSAHAALAATARSEFNGHEATQSRLHAVLAGMTLQSESMRRVTDEALDGAKGIGATVGRLVTGAQFQDRTAQHLKHVVGAIETLREAVEAMQRDSGAALPDLAAAGEVDEELLQQLLSRQTLSAVQRRFVARLSGKAADSSVEDAPAGDVDLF